MTEAKELGLFRRLSQKLSGTTHSLLKKDSLSRRSQSSGDLMTRSSTVACMNEESFSARGDRFSTCRESGPSVSIASGSTLVCRSQPRHLLEARAPTIVSAHVRFYPEIAFIDENNEQDIWVAVEISAETSEKPKDFIKTGGMTAVGIPGINLQTGSSIGRSELGLNVAIIIDNSFFSSPAALDTSKDLALEIITSLDRDHDRCAIFTTHNNPFCEGDGNTLPLLRIDTHRVSTFLNNILPVSPEPEARLEDFQKTIRKAVETVKQDWIKEDRGQCIGVLGHVIVMSPSLPELPNNIQLGPVQLHSMCPSMVQWKGSATGIGHGWQLLNIPSTRYTSGRTEDVQEAAEQQKLSIQKLVKDLRSLNPPGQLYDLELTLTAAAGCTLNLVEGNLPRKVIATGQKIFVCEASLKAGQRLFTIIRLTTDPRRLREGHPSAASKSSEDMMTEIVEMLGEASVELIKGRLKYRNSAFDSNMTFKSDWTCSVKRPVEPIYTFRCSQDALSKAAKIAVHKRVALFLAKLHPPQQAVNAITDTFGKIGLDHSRNLHTSACPVFITNLVRELNYQHAHAKRIPLLVSPLEVGSPQDSPSGLNLRRAARTDNRQASTSISISLKRSKSLASPPTPNKMDDAASSSSNTPTPLVVKKRRARPRGLVLKRSNAPQPAPPNMSKRHEVRPAHPNQAFEQTYFAKRYPPPMHPPPTQPLPPLPPQAEQCQTIITRSMSQGHRRNRPTHRHNNSEVIGRRSNTGRSTSETSYANQANPYTSNQDEAHKMWTEMRRGSRTVEEEERLQKRRVDLENNDENIKQLKDMAIRHQRSIGADTVISLSRAEETGMRNTPWC